MFNISIRETIKRLLPVDFKKTKRITFIYRLMLIPRQVKAAFLQLQNKLDYDIKFSSQTLSLETRLNQHYNLVQGSIYIETVEKESSGHIFWLSEEQERDYQYWKSEQQTPKYIYWQEEMLNSLAADFIVYVPSTLQFDSAELRAIINMYKLASKRYIIEAY